MPLAKNWHISVRYVDILERSFPLYYTWYIWFIGDFVIVQ